MKAWIRTILLFLVLAAVPTIALAQSRTLTLTTTPKAKVWVDGVYRGQADETGRLTIKPVMRGVRKVRVRAAGFREFNKSLTATQTSLLAKLVKTTNKGVLAFQEAEKMLSEDRYAAVDKYKEAIRLNPRLVRAYIGLARVQSSTGNGPDALETIKKLRRISPRNAEASAIEARVHRTESDIDKALNSFERAIKEGKGFQPEAHTGIALILKSEAEKAASEGDSELERLYYIDAAKSFETAIDQLSATEPVVYLFLGQIYEKLEMKEKAIAVYERFIKDMPDNEEVTAVQSFIEQLRRNN